MISQDSAVSYRERVSSEDLESHGAGGVRAKKISVGFEDNGTHNLKAESKAAVVDDQSRDSSTSSRRSTLWPSLRPSE